MMDTGIVKESGKKWVELTQTEFVVKHEVVHDEPNPNQINKTIIMRFF